MNNLKEINSTSGSACAIIPFYNESATLKRVIEETLPYVDFIIAVNDGSDDDTYEELKMVSNVREIRLSRNFGKGFALQTGFNEAITLGFETIVTLDADLQHRPENIPQLLSALNSYDIVIGNRLKNLKGMPFQRKISNSLTSFLLKIKTRQQILDSQCGFRAYKSDVLKSVTTKFYGFEAESEIIVKSAKSGFKIGFVDIPTVYGNEMSKMKSIQAITGFLKVLFMKIE